MTTVDQVIHSSEYILFIIAGAIFFIALGLIYLRKLERKRIKYVRKMEMTEPIEINPPEEDIETISINRATKSIKGRFYTIRWVFISLIIGFTALVIGIPKLPTISAAYITLLVAVLGVLAGMAAKPFVENFFAGLVITFAQPLRINDTVIIDGKYGTVERITMFFTIVKIWNWRRYILPNHMIVQKEFENLSLSDEYEWTHIPFYVSPTVDIEKVKMIAKSLVYRSKYRLKNQPPCFWVMDLQKDAILCWITCWVDNPANAWAIRAEVKKGLSKEFNKAGIDFQINNINIKHRNMNDAPTAINSSETL